jgi:hypothetical protein
MGKKPSATTMMFKRRLSFRELANFSHRIPSQLAAKGEEN